MNRIGIVILSLFSCTLKTMAQTYKYDNNQQLIEIKYDNGLTLAFQYDANSNRILYSTTATGTLPLTLLNFTAQKSGQQVLLNWTTTDEVNTDKFEVEYSKNGIAFSMFGTVPARGNTSGRTDYSTVHCCPVEGINYYRLKMIDKDGKFKYSEIRKVVFDFVNVMSVFPNPASDNMAINLSFTRAFTKDARVVVFSSTGAQIFSGSMSKGEKTYQIATNELAAGSYFVVVRVDGAEYKGEFIRQ